MSDIQEQIKIAHKKAKENDRTDTINIQDLFNERVEQNKRVEELVNINEKLSLALESAEQRIDKAVEYIENNEYFETEIFDCDTGGCLGTDLSIQAKTILNILKGKE